MHPPGAAGVVRAPIPALPARPSAPAVQTALKGHGQCVIPATGHLQKAASGYSNVFPDVSNIHCHPPPIIGFSWTSTPSDTVSPITPQELPRPLPHALTCHLRQPRAQQRLDGLRRRRTPEVPVPQLPVLASPPGEEAPVHGEGCGVVLSAGDLSGG